MLLSSLNTPDVFASLLIYLALRVHALGLHTWSLHLVVLACFGSGVVWMVDGVMEGGRVVHLFACWVVQFVSSTLWWAVLLCSFRAFALAYGFHFLASLSSLDTPDVFTSPLGLSISPSVLMRSACVLGRCTSSRSLVSVRGLSGWLGDGRWTCSASALPAGSFSSSRALLVVLLYSFRAFVLVY